jgi:hypothetical protein
MLDNQNFVTVTEAVQLTGKPEVTIRRLIKRLSLDSQTQSFVTVIDSNNPKSLYSIDRIFLLQFYKISHKLDDSHLTVSDLSSDSHLTVTQDFIDTLLKQLDTKDEQLKNKDKDTERLHQLIENQQKISLHSQMLLDKNMIQLEAKIEANKVKERKKFLGLF